MFSFWRKTYSLEIVATKKLNLLNGSKGKFSIAFAGFERPLGREKGGSIFSTSAAYMCGGRRTGDCASLYASLGFGEYTNSSFEIGNPVKL